MAIIEFGLAGLSAALICANKGLRVLVCAKSNPGSGSCTAISQCNFRTSVPGFPPQEHRHLTLEAGQGLNQSRTGLFTAGEVVGGLHGANRYGGNALSEAVVFGQIAGEQATQVAGQQGDRTGKHNDALDWCREMLQGLTGQTGDDQVLNSHVLKRQLQDIMWREAGVIPSQASLERAWKGLGELKAACPGPVEKGKGLASYLTARDSIAEIAAKKILVKESTQTAKVILFSGVRSLECSGFSAAAGRSCLV